MIFALLSVTISAFGEPSNLVARKINQPIKIDGHDRDEAWAQSNEYMIYDPYGRELSDSIQLTTFKILYDDENIYLYYEAEDDYIRATQSGHDSPTYIDDVVEVFLYPDGRYEDFYFAFEMTATGVLSDMLYFPRIGGGGDFSLVGYSPVGVEVATKVYGDLNRRTDKRQWYTLEVAIPISSFGVLSRRYPIESGSVWRAQISRWDKSERDIDEIFSSYFPTYGSGPHFPKRFGLLEFE